MRRLGCQNPDRAGALLSVQGPLGMLLGNEEEAVMSLRLTELPWSKHIDPKDMESKLAQLLELGSAIDDGYTEAAVVEAVSEWLNRDGIPYIVDPVMTGRPNLLATLQGNTPGPTLLLEAHSDTVAAGDQNTWTYPPFRLTKDGDRLYGRGSADTKGNLVAAYLGLRAFWRESRGSFPGKVLFLVPIDEEDLMTGIRHFIASQNVSEIDGAICCEPEDNYVCIAQKGALRLRAEIMGKMAHGAMPLTGSNPLPVLARFVGALEEEERAEQTRAGCHQNLGWPSITPTQVLAPISGSSGFNVVPASAALSIDCRTVPGQSHPDIIHRMEQRLQSIIADVNHDLMAGYGRTLQASLEPEIDPAPFQGRIVVVDERPITETPQDHPLVRAVAHAVSVILQQPPHYAGVPGATDGTWLWDQGVPIVTTGAGNRFVPHQVDEWVSLSQLTETALIYAEAAHRFLSDPQSVNKGV